MNERSRMGWRSICRGVRWRDRGVVVGMLRRGFRLGNLHHSVSRKNTILVVIMVARPVETMRVLIGGILEEMVEAI